MESAATIDVVAAVVRRNGRYLVCRRNLEKHHGGLWEFPGGKVEPTECFQSALQRELKEELELSLKDIGELLFTGSEELSPYSIHFIECSVEGDPRPIEHEAFSWVSAGELGSYDFAPVDRHFVETLLS